MAIGEPSELELQLEALNIKLILLTEMATVKQSKTIFDVVTVNS